MNIDKTNCIPLSANYPLNETLQIRNEFIEFQDGYRLFQHDIFTGVPDVAMNNKTMLSLTPYGQFFDFVTSEKSVAATDLVIFTGLRNRKTQQYITNNNGTLYATSPTLNANGFFKIVDVGGFYKIYQGTQVATIILSANKWDIVMMDELEDDPFNTQKFEINTNQTLDSFTIKAKFVKPEWASQGWTQPLERFWSYSAITSAVRSNGVYQDNEYPIDNNYIWESTTDVGMFAIGFDCDIKWVKYYNDQQDTKFNKTVDIKKTVNNIPLNLLVSCPIETKINIDEVNKIGRLDINLSSLKNVQTAEYRSMDIIRGEVVLPPIRGIGYWKIGSTFKVS